MDADDEAADHASVSTKEEMKMIGVVRRSARRALAATVLGAAALGTSGCVLVGPGNQYISFNGTRVGELHAQSGGANGYLATFYRPITKAIDDHYHGPCRGSGECTLRWLRGFSSNDYWRKATEPDEVVDFAGAIDDSAHQDHCLALHIKNSGENWTWRSRTDASCIP